MSDSTTDPESNTPAEPKRPDPEQMPDAEEMQEPSAEKDPGEEPKAPAREEPEPSHEAVGIGIIGRPQVEPELGDEGEGTDDAE
ncbi:MULTISPECIES: hypothetical protein [unclassified Microbacterium]|uniref:hypothetical protein n=1 Tax=unclassified Microbacterium TaxID=2609290 RepID=UPI001DAB0EF2|nr:MULTISPECIES: hypothetical protein [unclassified Microbacterium]CAH0190661.1 hypothetical protein SRABI121_02233 [Microbacterium sp. Bi121]HWK78201.1 hypothetical protein [Microbacterium sp.]